MPGDHGGAAIAYIVIKNRSGGRRYRYEQTSWREGKKVRTKSRCLGRADSGIGYMYGSAEADAEYAREMGRVEREWEQYRNDYEKQNGETVEQRDARTAKGGFDKAMADIGLTVPAATATPTPTAPEAPTEK